MGSRQQAEAIDDRLRLSVSDFYYPELKTEIDTFYPTSVIIKNVSYEVSYSYRPAETSYYGNKTEEFKATISLPPENVMSLIAEDISALGTSDQPLTLLLRVECDYHNHFEDQEIEVLKAKVDEFNIKQTWNAWTEKPDNQFISIEALQPLPTIASLGVTPLPYAHDYKGQPVLSYPAIVVVRNYNQAKESYENAYYIEYFANQAEADSKDQETLQQKIKADTEEQRRRDREVSLEPALRLLEQVEVVVKELYDDQAKRTALGINRDEARELFQSRLPEARALLKDYYGSVKADADPRQAAVLLQGIQSFINERKITREQSLRILPEVVGLRNQIQELAEEKLSSAYVEYGITEAEYDSYLAMWNEACQLLELTNRYDQDKIPDPAKARTLLESVRTFLAPKEKVADAKNRRFMRDMLAGKDSGYTQLLIVEHGRIIQAGNLSDRSSLETNPRTIPIGASSRFLRADGNRITLVYGSGKDGIEYRLPDGMFIVSRDADNVMQVTEGADSTFVPTVLIEGYNLDRTDDRTTTYYQDAVPAASAQGTGFGGGLFERAQAKQKNQGKVGAKTEVRPTPEPVKSKVEQAEEEMTETVRTGFMNDLAILKTLLDGTKSLGEKPKAGGKLTDKQKDLVGIYDRSKELQTTLRDLERQINEATARPASLRGKIQTLRSSIKKMYEKAESLVPDYDPGWIGKFAESWNAIVEAVAQNKDAQEFITEGMSTPAAVIEQTRKVLAEALPQLQKKGGTVNLGQLIEQALGQL